MEGTREGEFGGDNEVDPEDPPEETDPVSGGRKGTKKLRGHKLKVLGSKSIIDTEATKISSDKHQKRGIPLCDGLQVKVKEEVT